ncbi:MAG: Flp pilus assembly complex ATPase component TadA [Candidatus Thioglobus sp.]|jgi:type IV pilus assembly protein PilB|nr:Flp pilus assembly complex ATPase component TadA [Candidatus Thioglobus sp.]MBT6752075.1 Flp pilus assembly complex ATPase component TadA [Candidatus Thioglobus sp.]MBT6966281.1 Flp pilus assembly complex ATPase component TadA [Candidatus Thioglobus sp.]
MAKLHIPTESAKQIASFLVGYGLITEDQFSHATTSSNEGDKGLIETIIDFDFTDEVSIAKAISESYDIDFIDLTDKKIVDLSVVTLLPSKFICENRVVPIYLSDDILNVAISEPSTLNLMSSIRLLTDKTIHTYVATFSQINNLLKKVGNSPVVQKEDKERNVLEGEISTSEARSSEVIDFTDKVLRAAFELRVSDIHLEIYKKFARMRFRLDGVLMDQKKNDEFLFDHYAAVITRVKIMAKLDIANRRLPQDGAMSLKIGDHDVDFRVSILPTSFGERVVMRILDTSSISLTLETLGFQDEDEQAFKNAVDAPQGMVLVTGPTGSGKSTTLYAALKRVNREEINILTAEDPVEFTLDGVGQVHVKEDIGLTFSAALRSFLRQDPEVVMVGEIRDKETADIAIKASLTGHLVLSTLHTNDAVSTITRLINMGIAPYLITSSLTLIVAQRLARIICTNCKTEDETVAQSELASIGFKSAESSRITLYHGKGCSKCKKTGYKGRKGIYEVLRITDNIKDGILKNLTTPELLKIAKEKDSFSTMQEVGRGFLMQGSISLEEYKRVLMVE